MPMVPFVRGRKVVPKWTAKVTAKPTKESTKKVIAVDRNGAMLVTFPKARRLMPTSPDGGSKPKGKALAR
jgi:hypothetical protein